MLAAGCQLLLPLLLAQAGGGGNFGGTGGGGGGGGGGGDGGLLLYYLLRFVIRYPHIGIPLLIVVAVAFYWGKRAESNVRITRTIRRGRKIQERGLRDDALMRIRSRDPAFATQTFLQRVVRGFLRTQQAWSEQDLRSCRAFISDGVHERFELYIAMQRAENIRNRLKDVAVLNSEVVSVTSDSHFDTIHVRIAARAVSYDEDLDSGRRVSGGSPREPIVFSEVWSFSRRPGVQTSVSGSLLEGVCPNCGGPLEIVDRAVCPQCDSVVNSGQYDWVLAEITQDEEWVVPPARHRVPGWDVLSQRDAGLNFQHLEDRASVIFWRSMMAVYFDDLRYAAPVLQRQAASLPQLWSRPGEFWKTPAVGAVEVVRAAPAAGDPANDGFDRIEVLVRWSGTRAQGDRRQPRMLAPQRVFSHVMTLKRKQGATSNVDQAFASFSCPGCGAPIDVGKSDRCQFCDSPLNDGSLDWVLEAVGTYDALSAYQQEDRREEQLQSRGEVERLEADRLLNEPELLAALSRLVAADGQLHDKEKEYLKELAGRRGVPKAKLQQIFAAAAASDTPIALPESPQQARVFMDHLIRAALVDGQITRQESQLLRRAAERLGWADADLKVAVARNRKQLYQQAKAIIRERRQAATSESSRAATDLRG